MYKLCLFVPRTVENELSFNLQVHLDRNIHSLKFLSTAGLGRYRYQPQASSYNKTESTINLKSVIHISIISL